jgi:hypothetical protein
MDNLQGVQFLVAGDTDLVVSIPASKVRRNFDGCLRFAREILEAEDLDIDYRAGTVHFAKRPTITIGVGADIDKGFDSILDVFL